MKQRHSCPKVFQSRYRQDLCSLNSLLYKLRTQFNLNLNLISQFQHSKFILQIKSAKSLQRMCRITTTLNQQLKQRFTQYSNLFQSQQLLTLKNNNTKFFQNLLSLSIEWQFRKYPNNLQTPRTFKSIL